MGLIEYASKEMATSSGTFSCKWKLFIENKTAASCKGYLICYLKKHNRILPGIAKIRISHCLAPISTLIGSKFTTKYVVTEEAERAYNEKSIYY